MNNKAEAIAMPADKFIQLQEANEIPKNPDGTDYEYIMQFKDHRGVALSNTVSELMPYVIRNYEAKPNKLVARLDFLYDIMFNIRIYILAGMTEEDEAKLTDFEKRVLNGDERSFFDEETGKLLEWTCDYPIVLLDAYYPPYGPNAYPLFKKDENNKIIPNKNVIILESITEKQFLESLNKVHEIHFGRFTPNNHIDNNH